MRFLSVVRRHKYIVLVSMILVAAVGALKILSDSEAPTVYRSAGTVLLQHSHSSVDANIGSTPLTQDKSFGSILLSDAILEKALAKLQPPPPEINQKAPKESWVRQFRETISVHQDKSRPSLLEISCASTDPQVPGAALNAVVQSAQEFLRDNEQNMTLELVNSLDQERTELETRLFARERELFEAQRQAGEFSINEDTEVIHPLVQRALDLNQSCIDSQRKRVQLEAALTATRKSLQQGGNLSSLLKSIEPLLDGQQVGTLLDLTQQEALSALRQQQHEHGKELATLRRYYGAAHPKVAKLQDQMRRDAEHLSAATAKLLDGANDPAVGARLLRLLEESLAIESEREAVLLRTYDQAAQEAMQVNHRLAEIAIAKREVSLLRHLHDTILDRLARIDVSDNHVQTHLVVLNEPPSTGVAIPKTSPVRTLALALAVGLVVGLAIVYAIDVLDDHFRSPEELSDQLGIPILAMVRDLNPHASEGAEALQVHVSPQSVESEAFRTLRTTLALSGEERERLAVTSAEPSDGKTTVLANLGVSYAQAGKKTLLIDADLRRPGLTRLFALRGREGLANVLRSDADIEPLCAEYVLPTDVQGLHVMASGPRPTNPAELLSSYRLSELLAWAEAHYDQVLVDCPPILAASEPAIVGRLVDGLVLVIQPPKNRRRLLLQATRDLNALRVNVIGAVANRIGTEETAGYGYRDYGYGYGYGDGYADGEEEHEDGTFCSDDGTSKEPSRHVVAFRRAA